MADPLPTPAQQGRTATRPLDPTEVIPGPQPLATTDGAEARIISGEVINGRHCPSQSHRAPRSAIGTAFLAATGAAVGLGLLLTHESSDAIAARVHEPVKSAPDQAPDQTIDPALAAVSAPVPAEQSKAAGSGAKSTTATTGNARTTASLASSSSSSNTAASSSSGTARHARLSGNLDSADWQEALARAAAAQRSAEQSYTGGRHRGGGLPQGGGDLGQGQGFGR
jgi:hypothetical protein